MPVIERVDAKTALERVRAVAPYLTDGKTNHGAVDVTCPPEHIVELMKALRDAEELDCRFFTFLSAVDRSEVADNPGGLEVLIHLYSPDRVIHVTVHVPVDADRPSCPSITEVFSGAIWHERETHEMFGIDFPGHPRLVNLYLPEDFEGHPGLRSFKLPSRAVKPWPGAKDPEEAAGR